MDLVTQLALEVLTTAEPLQKVAAARKAAVCWTTATEFGDQSPPYNLPDRPARPPKPVLTDHRQVPKRKTGSAKGRIALVHALAHIELNAIDLAFDMAARFAGECQARLAEDTRETSSVSNGNVSDGGVACEFISDWIRIGSEEAEHFELLENRLRDLGSFYGAMNAHDGLWQAAVDTKDNWSARLAIVPMVLEARGLDVTLATVAELRGHGDLKTAEILEKIYKDEIGHVETGVKWFTRLCEVDGVKPDGAFKSLVAEFFKGQIKPPFNEEARTQAGLLPHFYQSSAS